MTYLVLARKKRPQTFEDVVGQRTITHTLQNAISQNRVAHAFLFTGPRGVGKTSTARILAKALNCERGPQINPCNQCSVCKEISDGNSIDVIEIDGASNRGIDEVRELRENIRYSPAKSRYKIYIIDEVHMLTLPAFNALLKTLEEPPAHVLFIFATTEPHKIPATILSRCQRYDFKRIAIREMVDHLRQIIEEEKIEITSRGLFILARESEGSMRDAQSLLDRLISYGGNRVRDEEITEVLGLIDRKVLSDAVEAIARRDAGQCLEMVDRLYQFGHDIQHFCRELLQYLRDLILIKVSSNPESFLELPPEEVETLKQQAEWFQFEQLNQLFALLLKGEELIAQSTFPKVLLEMTLVRMSQARSLLAIDEVLKRLEALEKAVPGEGRKEASETPPGNKTGNSVSPPKENRERVREEIRKIIKGETPAKPSPSQHASPLMPPSLIAAEPPKEARKEEPPPEQPQENQEAMWKELVDFARARNPVLGAFLALGRLVRLTEDRIEIGFEKESFHYDRMMERENRGLLERICLEFLKREANVVISSFDGEARPRGRADAARKKTGAIEEGEAPPKREDVNPLIQEALRIFNGKIVTG